MSGAWTDAADAVMAGDQVVAAAYVTPARGVVLLPLTNAGVRDRDAGRLTAFTSSIGMWKKLARIRADPHVAVAYHSRTHGFSERSEFVLVQGRATVGDLDDRTWIDRHRESWERFAGPRGVGLWERPLRTYHWRVPVELDVERVLVWPELTCAGEPQLLGTPLPAAARPQAEPRGGTAPRIDTKQAARRLADLPHLLVGWVGGDGYPVVAPVGVRETQPDGIRLGPRPGLLPDGGRRAGLLGHSFARYTIGQHQRRHTGWLEAGGDDVVYAPHTEAGYRLPRSRLLYRAGAAVATNRGLRAARRAGFVT